MTRCSRILTRISSCSSALTRRLARTGVTNTSTTGRSVLVLAALFSLSAVSVSVYTFCPIRGLNLLYMINVLTYGSDIMSLNILLDCL